MTYYDKTECQFIVRTGEHLSLPAVIGKGVNNSKKLAVKDHCLFFNHASSFEDFLILMYESNQFKILIKESLLVSSDKSLLKSSKTNSPPIILIPLTIIHYLLDNL